MAEARKGYPWKRWADGRYWLAIRKKHFQCSITGFRNTLYSKAKRLKQSVEVHELRNGKGVKFRFVTPSEN